MTPTNQIAVFIELNDRQIAAVSLELLSKARQLADQDKTKVVALVCSPNNEIDTEQLIAGGADEVRLLLHPQFEKYSTLPFTSALTQTLREIQPDILLLGASRLGRDLAPRLAARLNTGLSADCLDLRLEDGILYQTKPTYGGDILADICCPHARPQMTTIRPHVFGKPQPDLQRTGQVNITDLSDQHFPVDLTICDSQSEQTQCITITDAKTIVCGGRGMQDEQTFDLCRQLAHLLSGTEAGTRPAVDEGWIAPERQIGLSGVTVQPDLLIVCGISGALQFTVGIEKAKTIIAINQDPKAPIFDYADIGLVGDVQEIIPLLMAKLEKRKHQNSAAVL